MANNSIFATSYHTKVAVADGKRFWLSSGNWQNSNQPDIDPIAKPSDIPEMKKRNREWHVVIDHPGLAKLFREFIEHDRKQARPHNRLPKKLREIEMFVAADDILEIVRRGATQAVRAKLFSGGIHGPTTAYA